MKHFYIVNYITTETKTKLILGNDNSVEFTRSQAVTRDVYIFFHDWRREISGKLISLASETVLTLKEIVTVWFFTIRIVNCYTSYVTHFGEQ